MKKGIKSEVRKRVSRSTERGEARFLVSSCVRS